MAENRVLIRIFLVSILYLIVVPTAQAEVDGKFSVSFESLKVPLFHDAPDGKQIEIRYAKMQRLGTDIGIPIFYFSGGPGESATRIVNRYLKRGWLNKIFRTLAQYGPIYFMDQRGTGGSEPNQRSCEPTESVPKILTGSEAEYQTRAAAIAVACRKTVSDFSTYIQSVDTLQAAEDFELLRKHLNISKITLFGISYGSHIGLAYIRAYQRNIDRAILALVEGPNQTFKLPYQFDAAVKNIDLDRTMRGKEPIVDLLKSSLKDFEGGQHISANAKDGTLRSLVVSQFELKMFFRGFFGSNRQIDKLYSQLTNKDFGNLLNYVEGLRSLKKFNLKYYVTDCGSYASEDRLALIESQKAQSLLGNALNFPFPSICSKLQVKPLAAAFRSSVESDVPTLMFSGDKDYKTPKSNAVGVSKGFSRVKHVVQKSGFHRFCRKVECLEILNEFMKRAPSDSSSELFVVE